MLVPKSRLSFGRGLLALGLIFGIALALRHWLLSSSPSTVNSAQMANSTNDLPPWGQIQRVRITIERPRGLISTSPDRYPPQTSWFFGGAEPNDLEAMLRRAGIPSEALDRTRWVVDARGIRVPVSTALVLALSAQARQQLYPILGRFPENVAQNNAYRFRRGEEDEWFAHSEFAPQTLARVKSQLYQAGDVVCFADLAEILTQVDSPAERIKLVKTLSREATTLAKLQVDAGTDIERLLKYWGRRGRAKDLEPLLESLKRVPGGATIDVAHLLPPFARMRLYTYPLPLPNAEDTVQDCFWTSFNFFQEPPENRYRNTADIKAALDKSYFIAQDEPQLGDILMLADERGMAIHAAVYVADDIVFTKNGAAFTHSWLLMELRDMLAIYSLDGKTGVIVYRLKDTD